MTFRLWRCFKPEILSNCGHCVIISVITSKRKREKRVNLKNCLWTNLSNGLSSVSFCTNTKDFLLSKSLLDFVWPMCDIIIWQIVCGSNGHPYVSFCSNTKKRNSFVFKIFIPSYNLSTKICERPQTHRNQSFLKPLAKP